MTEQNLASRALHDISIAAWFGGALMGAIGLNGASADIADPTDQARVTSVGWARWAPVNAVAIGAHLVGGYAILRANRGRARHQRGVGANTIVKTAATGLALGSTAYSGYLGATISKEGAVPASSGTVPASSTPDHVAKAQQQQRLLQLGHSGAHRSGDRAGFPAGRTATPSTPDRRRCRFAAPTHDRRRRRLTLRTSHPSARPDRRSTATRSPIDHHRPRRALLP